MHSEQQDGSRGRLIATAAAVLLVVTGTVVFVTGLDRPDPPPQPPAVATFSSASGSAQTSVSPPVPTTSATSSASEPPKTTGLIMARSAPTHLHIPSIGVSTAILRLGMNPDKTVQVPPLGADSKAGWFQYSPTPGQLGPAVILGHVDSAEYGPGVFYKLGALKPGAIITITRADNTIAVFRVDRTVSYPKNSFPTLQVYGNTNHAALRLITCGGTFDLTNRNYTNNIVTYATLTSSHPA